MKNGTTTGNDHIIIETLKTVEDTMSKTLAKLCTKCLSERRIPTARKNAKMVTVFKKGNKKVKHKDGDGKRHQYIYIYKQHPDRER